MTSPVKVSKLNEVTSRNIQTKIVEKKLVDVVKQIDDEKSTDNEIIVKLQKLIGQNELEMKAFIRKFQMGRDSKSLLHYAAFNLRPKLCEYLIDIIKINVNKCTNKFQTPLHMFVESNIVDDEKKLTETLKTLVDRRCELNIIDQDGLTPLHNAVQRNNFKIVQLLSTLSDINLSAENKQGLSSLHIAINCGYDKIALHLIRQADVEKLISSSLTDTLPIHSIVELKEEKLELVLEILEKIQAKKQIYLSYTLLYKLNAQKRSILQIAIENNHLNIVEAIIKRFYPDFEKHDANGNLPIHLAAQNGSIAVLNILAKYNAVSYSSNECSNENPLHIAASKNHFAFIVEFLKIETNHIRQQNENFQIEPISCINQKNKQSYTPLFLAVIMDNIKCVEALLQHSPNMTTQMDSDGNSIIHTCAKFNNVEILRYFLKLPSFLDTIFIQNGSKELPLHVAAKNGHIEILKLILAKFYDGSLQSKDDYISQKDLNGRNCLHWACLNGFSNIVEYLLKDLKLSFLVTAIDTAHSTPLHFAASHGHLSIVEILVGQDNTLKLNAKNLNKQTPLLLSFLHGHTEIAKLLIGRKGSIEEDETDRQLIHIAAKNGWSDIVELLLSKGAPINYLNKTGENCLDIALAADQREVTSVLLRDHNWKQLIETAPKNNKLSKKSILQLDFMDSKSKNSYNKMYTGENPQLYQMFEKKMWDMYLIILDNAIDRDSVGSFDFEVIDPICKSVKKHPLMLVARSGQESLLTHQAVQKLLYLKWRCIPRIAFYSYFIFYCIFLTLFGLYSMELAEMSMENAKIGKLTNMDRIFETEKSLYFYPVMACVAVIGSKIFWQIVLIDGLSYLTSVVSWIEVLTLVTTCMALLSEKLAQKTQLSSIAILSLFTTFTFLIQKLKVIGVYVLAFRRTLLNSSKFLPVFLIIYTGFILSFRVRVDTNLQYFNSTTSTSFLSGIIMMMGDFQTQRMGVDSTMNYFLYLAFIAIMSIIILNLFVGIAVGEIKQTLDEADIQQISMRIVYILKVQDALRIFQRNSFLARLMNMRYAHYNYKMNENSFSKALHAYSFLISSRLQSSSPDINLVNPQMRLEESLAQLATDSHKNFKIIKDALHDQMIEVNEKLNNSKQRLEDCLTEMSRKTNDNFEISAEDSSTALLAVEKNLVESQTRIINTVYSIEHIMTKRLKSAKESIIQHIKNSDIITRSHHTVLFDKLSLMLKTDLSNITDNNKQITDQTMSEFRVVTDILGGIEAKINLFQDNFDEMNQRLNEIQSSPASLNTSASSKATSSGDPEGAKFKMTPYIKAFKSRLELRTSEGTSAESVTNRSSSDNSDFISKINKFGEKKSQTRPPSKKE